MQQGIVNVSIEEMISNTVVASWPELLANDTSSLVHVEYHRTAPNKELQYLKIWALEQKEWQLVCQYWIEGGDNQGVTGLTFSNNFYSVSFGHLLKAVLDNQGTFSDLCEQSRDGLIQIQVPSDEQRASALTSIQLALADRSLCDEETIGE
jgi:hypothetical protein